MSTNAFRDFFVDLYLAVLHAVEPLGYWLWAILGALLILALGAIYALRTTRATGTDGDDRPGLQPARRNGTSSGEAAAARPAVPAATPAHGHAHPPSHHRAADANPPTQTPSSPRPASVQDRASAPAGDTPPARPTMAPANPQPRRTEAPADPATIVDAPAFSQPQSISATGHFRVPHPSDAAAYKELDAAHRLQRATPLSFPKSRGGVEPILTLDQVWGPDGAAVIERIRKAGQIVFHAAGDTGNTRSTEPQELLATKLISDFDEAKPSQSPAFFFHLGDVIYSFGEAKYYYDQFYEPYRNYPAPILAIAGNHDGMIEPRSGSQSLGAFLDNFCTPRFCKAPEAGNLDRTTMIQPGVYFTFEAPFLRVIGLYSNALEDPGVISSQGGTVQGVTDVQLEFLTAAFNRVKKDGFTGAVVIAVHHPPFTASMTHSGSPAMLRDLDSVSVATGVWPHAVLAAHAHNYQRFTRQRGDLQIPYVVAGNGGHGLTRLHRGNGPSLRVPMVLPARAKEGEKVTLECYDDQDYGYLRILVNATQLRIEYHPASDGPDAKTPDDHVTIDLKSRRMVHYDA